MIFEFSGQVWYWRGPAPWYFVTVPAAECAEILAVASGVSYGWGMIPASIEIGHSRWETALWPKDGHYIVPIKTNVRRAEGIDEGDEVAVRLSVSV